MASTATVILPRTLPVNPHETTSVVFSNYCPLVGKPPRRAVDITFAAQFPPQGKADVRGERLSIRTTARSAS
ncbi:hypothetical protein KCP78_01885 [Salmonella enterica subsp. enterica]|nr:hypothetical protein KCP78_01885 [Salmonella enterica subsp. enterica]